MPRANAVALSGSAAVGQPEAAPERGMWLVPPAARRAALALAGLMSTPMASAYAMGRRITFHGDSSSAVTSDSHTPSKFRNR
jgi:hypothetical protein